MEPQGTRGRLEQTVRPTVFGLTADIWSRDVTKAMRMADRIEAGTVHIDNCFNAATQSPVVGFKQSGYGRENGLQGCAACSGRCRRGPASSQLAYGPAAASFRAVGSPLDRYGSPRATDQNRPRENGHAGYR